MSKHSKQPCRSLRFHRNKIFLMQCTGHCFHFKDCLKQLYIWNDIDTYCIVAQ